jgi:hypothetical protein
VEAMEDQVRVRVPVRNYPVSGVSLLARRSGRMYEVAETAASGAIDFMDNLEWEEREGRELHTGQEILAALAGHLERHRGEPEAEVPDDPASPPTFAERLAHRHHRQYDKAPG